MISTIISKLNRLLNQVHKRTQLLGKHIQTQWKAESDAKERVKPRIFDN
jgi:hypothetical protein